MTLRLAIIPLVILATGVAAAEHNDTYQLACAISGSQQRGDAPALELGSAEWTIQFAQPSLYATKAPASARLSVTHDSSSDARAITLDLAGWRQSVSSGGTKSLYAFWTASNGQAFPVSRVWLENLDDGRFALKAEHSDFATCPHGPAPGSSAGECESTQHNYSGVCELKPEATS